MKLTEVKLSDLRPNPFRDIEVYPFDEEKVARLVESINSTGFWPSVIARGAGFGYEIAFGHHRVEAAKRAGVKEASIVVKNLSDDEMLKMMVDENAIEYGHDFLSTLNSVQAVVKAFGSGGIVLEKPVTEGKVRGDKYRSAPSFLSGQKSDAQNLYTATTIASYLGWIRPGGQVDNRVNVAISALELIELGICKVEQFRGLSGQAATAVVRDAQISLKIRERELKALEDEKEKRLARAAIQKAISKRVEGKVEQIKKGDISIKQLHQESKKEKERTFSPREKKEGKDISKPVASTTLRITKMVDNLEENKETLRFLYNLISKEENPCPTPELNALRTAFANLKKKAEDNLHRLEEAIVERRQ